MAGASTQFDREMEALDRDYAEGRLTRAEHNKAVRELERDYAADARGAAEDAARDAYEQELGRW